MRLHSLRRKRLKYTNVNASKRFTLHRFESASTFRKSSVNAPKDYHKDLQMDSQTGTKRVLTFSLFMYKNKVHTNIDNTVNLVIYVMK